MDKQTTDLVLIDIGGTSIKYGHFVPENLTITDKGSIPTPKGADNILIAIGQIVADILAKYPLTDAVAISSAGIIDSENGVVYEANEDLMPGYTGTAIAAYIQTNYGLSCHVENDVNCAALAEYYQGAAKGSSSCLMLTIGTGIGGAFIYDGKLLKGHTFSACEVGYMHMKESSFEELGATSVLVKKTAKALGVEDETLDGKKIFDMAYNGIGLTDITTYLTDNNIKTPSSLKRKNPNSKAKYNPIWTISSVKKILKNQKD